MTNSPLSKNGSSPQPREAIRPSGENRPGESRQRTASTWNPAWLVSVRDETECRLVADYPVDIIDFKEPSEGPLAPVDPHIWHQAQRWVTDCGVAERWDPGLKTTQQVAGKKRVKLSAALGERTDMLQVAPEVPRGFAFAKVGPSGCDTPSKLTTLWSDARARLPKSVELVAVAYADHASAECLPPEQIVALAGQVGLNRCLIDTFTKSSGSTVDLLGIEWLRRFSQAATQQGSWWALAGAIRLEAMSDLAANGVLPNCVGVRGDVCGQSRTSTLAINRLDQWSMFLSQIRGC